MDGTIITANRLENGTVVYLSSGGSWTEILHEARLLKNADDEERLMRIAGEDVTRLIIVDPYVMKARQEPGGLKTLSQREHIRATGPTVLPGSRLTATAKG